MYDARGYSDRIIELERKRDYLGGIRVAEGGPDYLSDATLFFKDRGLLAPETQ